VLDPQSRLDLVLDHADHHLRAGPFLALPIGRETLGLAGSVATFASVAGQLLADGALTAPDGLSDLVLGLSGLLHVGDHFTVFRTESVVFIAHSQFVVKPD
jgi:hypothetical protein